MAERAFDEPIWTQQGASKRAAVQGMFAQIAPRYDLLNRLVSLNLDRRWRAAAVRQLALKPGESALDVCCGTGDFLMPLRAAVGATGRVAGLDFCLPMLQVAQTKKGTEPLTQGDACALPIASASVDAVTVGWGIRNVPDIDLAHREIFRVLKAGGRFVSLDTAIPRNALVRRVSHWVSLKGIPMLGRFFGHAEAYSYLPESTQRFWNRERLAASMGEAGFEDVGYRDFFFGNICMHWGRKP